MREKFVNVLKKYKLRILIGVVAAAVLGTGVAALVSLWPYMGIEEVAKEQLDELELDGYDKLMIVAHPDDELIWGGGHLLEEDYFVVCITNGQNEVRSKEFADVLEATGDKGIIMDYPDKIAGKRSEWSFWKDNIESDLQTIIDYKDWEIVVTHNEKGEYGHQHHIMTHELVNEAYDATECVALQQYFGTYYAADKVPNELERIEDDTYYEKREVARIYKSQRNTMLKLYHMLPHENWI